MLVPPWALLALAALLVVFVLVLVALVGFFIVRAAGLQRAAGKQHRERHPAAAPAPRPSFRWWTVIVGIATIIGASFTAANFFFQ